MTKRSKTIWTVLSIILGIVVIIGIVGGIYSWRFISGSHNIVVGGIDLSRVPDGTYEGSYSFFHDSAKVRVAVRDHRITAIELLTKPGAAEDQVPTLTDRILEEQTVQVDLVSGASVSQKVFLKAVENALTNAAS